MKYGKKDKSCDGTPRGLPRFNLLYGGMLQGKTGSYHRITLQDPIANF